MLVNLVGRYARCMRLRRQTISAPPLEDPWADLLCRSVMVLTEKGDTIRGVLWDRRGPLLVIKNAYFIEGSNPAESIKVDGEVVIERSKVEFMQIIPTSEV